MYYEIVLLNTLMESPNYGYTLRKKLISDMEICTSINSNTIYSILKKYEKLGVVTKETEVFEGKPPRYVYTMTGYGRKFFVSLLRDFSDALIDDRDEFCIRLSFFQYLDKPARSRLLNLREKYLSRTKDRLNKMDSLPKPNKQHRLIFKDFHIDLIIAEEKLINHFYEKLDDPCIIDENGNMI